MEEEMEIKLPIIHRLATFLNRKIGGADPRKYRHVINGVTHYFLGYDTDVLSVPPEAWSDHDMQIWKAKSRWGGKFRRIR